MKIMIIALVVGVLLVASVATVLYLGASIALHRKAGRATAPTLPLLPAPPERFCSTPFCDGFPILRSRGQELCADCVASQDGLSTPPANPVIAHLHPIRQVRA